jgi:hypothetical protein
MRAGGVLIGASSEEDSHKIQNSKFNFQLSRKTAEDGGMMQGGKVEIQLFSVSAFQLFSVYSPAC